MKKIFTLFIISILAHYHISTLSAQVPTTPGSYQWVKGFGSAFQPSTTDERISFSKLDNEGNLIISGIVAGYPHFPGLAGKKDSIVSNHWQQASKNTGFLAKYDCDGNLLWLRMLNDSINGTGIGDFVIDSANNIYAAMYCTFGTTNLYWNDSLFCQFSWTPTMVSEFILVKVDKNGHMKWIWGEPYHTSGNSLGYGAVTQVNSGSPMANAMILSNDTISYFTYFGNTYGIALNGKPVHTGMNILDFSIKTGALLNHTNITDTLGFWVGGIGKDKTGNFIIVSNLEHKSINFLDSTYSRPTASQFNPLSTIIKFNRNHVIRHIELGDSTGAGSIAFNNNDNSFTILGGGRYGKPIYGGYATHLAATGFGKIGGTGVLKFKDFTTLDWGQCPDSTGGNRGFFSLASDINNDSYAHLPYNDLVKFQNLSSHIPHTQFRSIIVKLSKNNGTLLSHLPDLNTTIANSSTNLAAFQNILVDKQGNIYATGNITSNNVVVGTDTAKYYGGQNDMFIIKYGNVCGNNLPMIAAGTPGGLQAACNGTSSINIKWNLVKNGEDKYYIYRSLAANSGYVKIDSVAPTINTYTDANVVLSTNYWYAVSTHNVVGEGYLSLADSARLCDTLGGFVGSVSAKNQLSVFPNPTKESLVVSRKLLANTIEVCNLLGQHQHVTIEKLNTNDFRLTTEYLPSGLYFIKATDINGNVLNGKFVKE